MTLDEIEALLAKATEEPWYHAQAYDDKGVLFKRWIATDIGPFNNVTEFVHSPWDAELIVAAVNWCRSEGIAAARERDRLREALALADAALRGANMNMHVVERKVGAVLKGE